MLANPQKGCAELEIPSIFLKPHTWYVLNKDLIQTFFQLPLLIFINYLEEVDLRLFLMI